LIFTQERQAAPPGRRDQVAPRRPAPPHRLFHRSAPVVLAGRLESLEARADPEDRTDQTDRIGPPGREDPHHHVPPQHRADRLALGGPRDQEGQEDQGDQGDPQLPAAQAGHQPALPFTPPLMKSNYPAAYS
jgi:hypothetical protein